MEYDQNLAMGKLLEIMPESELFSYLGLHCFKYETTTPAHKFVEIIMFRNDGVLVLKARDSYDANLAEQILGFVAPIALNFSKVSVYSGFSYPNKEFNHITIVPPEWSSCFTQSDYLRSVAFWAFPSHRCEIQEGFIGSDFGSLISKGSRISVINWDRNIIPQIRLRLLTDWTGGMLAKGRKPFLNPWDSSIFILKCLPCGQAVELMNSKQELTVIAKTKDGWRLSPTYPEISRNDVLATNDIQLIKEMETFCLMPNRERI